MENQINVSINKGNRARTLNIEKKLFELYILNILDPIQKCEHLANWPLSLTRCLLNSSCLAWEAKLASSRHPPSPKVVTYSSQIRIKGKGKEQICLVVMSWNSINSPQSHSYSTREGRLSLASDFFNVASADTLSRSKPR